MRTKSRLCFPGAVPTLGFVLALLAPVGVARAEDGDEAPKTAKTRETKKPREIKKARDLSRAKSPSRFLNRKGVRIPSSLPLGLKAELTPQPTAGPGPGPDFIPPPVVDSPPPSAPSAEGETVVPNFDDLKKAGTKRCKPLPPTAKVTFDFKGEIQELVEAISKTTCKNFILTNKVRSQKFEIISPSPITVEESWRAFLSALEANDFTVIQVGRYYKIIQAPEATRAPVPIYDSAEAHPVNDRMVTKIWRVRYASDINAVVNYLNVFKSGKGQIHAFQATNTVICTDFGTSVTRLERVLQEIDQPGVLEQLRIVQVQYAAAAEIAERLSQVFEPQKAGAPKSPQRIAPTPASRARGRAAKEPPDEYVNVSKILADVRTNKLIIIASDQALKQILALLRELDVPEQGGGQIQVVRLKHASAEELASTLASLAQGRPTTARPRVSPTPAGGAKPPTTPAGATTALFEGDVKVTADKATNSLVVTASKADFNSMKSVIDRLDVPRFQVFVEAIIMEISVKRSRQLGAGWHGGIAPTIDGQRTPILFGSTPTKELSSILATTNPLSLASLLGFAGAFKGPTLAGSETFIPGISGGIPALGVVIQALQSSNDVNVVSTPHLLTMDNEEAEIQVNEKRPFPSGLSLGNLSGLASGLTGGSAAGALGNISNLGLGSVSFNREDVGLTLKLKPQINDDEFVRLEIDQELSDVAGVDQVTGQTITSKRSAKTVVVVRSQDSVVVGGLVRERESIDEAKTPLFGDLPLIGWLFKRQQKSNDKVNLVLILTPYIIRGPDDFREIFERKMSEREEFANQFYGSAGGPSIDIDWRRKLGPVASYRLTRLRSLRKAENDGPGEDGETIIRFEEPEAKEIAPMMTAPVESTTQGLVPDSAPAVPPYESTRPIKIQPTLPRSTPQQPYPESPVPGFIPPEGMPPPESVPMPFEPPPQAPDPGRTDEP